MKVKGRKRTACRLENRLWINLAHPEPSRALKIPRKAIELDMPSWKIPVPFRYYTSGHAVVPAHGQTVDAALADLVNQYPNLKPHLFKGNGELRAFVNIFLGEDNIKNLQGIETAIGEDDELRLVPAITGG